MIDRTHDLSIAKQAEALGISRGSVYYRPRSVSAADLAIMRRMDQLHLELPFAGSRMLRDLLNREGIKIGRSHVGTLMKRMGIKALYRKPNTSKPAPGHKIYPYLLRGMTIDRPNQVWAMDITYVPMARGFVYLAAAIDWFSRRVLAWRLSITIAQRSPGGMPAEPTGRRRSASRRWKRPWPATAGRRSSTPIRAASLVSTGRRNTSLTGSQHGVEGLGRCPPAEGLAGPGVERRGHGREVVRAVEAQVGAFREVLPQQTVGVLVRAALPRAVGVAEVDLNAGLDPQLCVLAHLRPLIPGQRPPQPLGQGGDRAGDGVADRLGAVPGERGPVPHAGAEIVARHARQVEQDREPRRAFHQGADGRAAQPQDEVPLPVARHRPVGRLRRALGDHDLGGHEGLAPAAAARPRHPRRPPGAQAGRQLAAQRAAVLHVQRLVDGLVADAHRPVVGKVEPQAAGDLFRAPRRGPAPVLPTPVSATLPGHDRSGNSPSVRSDDQTGQPVLHVTPQRRVR